MIRFICIVIFVILFLVLSIPLLIAEWIIGRFNPELKSRSSLAIVNWAFRVCLWLAGTQITYLGEDRVPKDVAVLYIGNHRSYFDILMTYVRVPRPTGYIAKKEMLRYPLLVNWMKNLHCLFLDRKDIKEGMKTILAAIEKIRSGISICIFRRAPGTVSPIPSFRFTRAVSRSRKRPDVPSSPWPSSTPETSSRIIFPASKRRRSSSNTVNPSTPAGWIETPKRTFPIRY